MSQNHKKLMGINMKKKTNFYGSIIKTGALHKKMHVKQGKPLSLKRVESELSKVKKQVQSAKKGSSKRKALVKKERELAFAKNAKTKFNK